MQRRSWMVPTVGSWLPGCHRLKLKQGMLFLLWLQDSWEFYSSPPNNALPSANSERRTQVRDRNGNYQREKEKWQESEIRRKKDEVWIRNKVGGRQQEDSDSIFPGKRNWVRMSSPYQFLEGQTAESLTGCIFWKKRKLSPHATALSRSSHNSTPSPWATLQGSGGRWLLNLG